MAKKGSHWVDGATRQPWVGWVAGCRPRRATSAPPKRGLWGGGLLADPHPRPRASAPRCVPRCSRCLMGDAAARRTRGSLGAARCIPAGPRSRSSRRAACSSPPPPPPVFPFAPPCHRLVFWRVETARASSLVATTDCRRDCHCATNRCGRFSRLCHHVWPNARCQAVRARGRLCPLMVVAGGYWAAPAAVALPLPPAAWRCWGEGACWRGARSRRLTIAAGQCKLCCFIVCVLSPC